MEKTSIRIPENYLLVELQLHGLGHRNLYADDVNPEFRSSTTTSRIVAAVRKFFRKY
jgi:hypothetical protein